MEQMTERKENDARKEIIDHDVIAHDGIDACTGTI